VLNAFQILTVIRHPTNPIAIMTYVHPVQMMLIAQLMGIKIIVNIKYRYI